MENKREIVIVIESLGAGYEEKSKDYGDEGANTLGHIFEATMVFIRFLVFKRWVFVI